MEKKRLLMDQDAIMRAIRRISHEILERNKGLSDALIVGIERRGVILAKRLQEEIERIEGVHIDCESLNVAIYRDDRDARRKEGGKPCTIDTTEKTIILVDDVLYTGRTIRAALNALMTAGRPRSIQLAVLVDRGHRELPIRADYVGKNIPTSHLESVRVAVKELDGEEGVTIQE
nr:bifunctional pyr operon transcriptional regulator/uracil phosphoribosyltransferase PyrR [Veillonella denticariosi]